MSGVVLWDFDGTLGHRPGRWSGCCIEALDRHLPGHGIRPDQIVPLLSTGFPWHSPDVSHPHLCDSRAWWRELERLLASVFEQLGFAQQAAELAHTTHLLYVEPKRFKVFEDVWPALDMLKAEGWCSAILSNHVPELPLIVTGLGLDLFIDEIVNSAATGYEKPHPKAFELALSAMGNPTQVWMVGDNYDADIGGAEAVGIDSILIRGEDERASQRAKDAVEAAQLVLRASPP